MVVARLSLSLLFVASVAACGGVSSSDKQPPTLGTGGTPPVATSPAPAPSVVVPAVGGLIERLVATDTDLYVLHPDHSLSHYPAGGGTRTPLTSSGDYVIDFALTRTGVVYAATTAAKGWVVRTVGPTGTDAVTLSQGLVAQQMAVAVDAFDDDVAWALTPTAVPPFKTDVYIQGRTAPTHMTLTDEQLVSIVLDADTVYGEGVRGIVSAPRSAATTTPKVVVPIGTLDFMLRPHGFVADATTLYFRSHGGGVGSIPKTGGSATILASPADGNDAPIFQLSLAGTVVYDATNGSPLRRVGSGGAWEVVDTAAGGNDTAVTTSASYLFWATSKGAVMRQAK
jgi:hypothetical protein